MQSNLNIVTYNIQHGKNTQDIIANILSLAHKNINIFCLQEVREYPSKPFIVDTLLKDLGPSWQAECLVKGHTFDLGLCTLWDSSKIRSKSFEKLLLPKLPKLRFYEKAFSKVRVRMEKVTESKIEPTQRAALIGEFELSGQLLRITNLHLDWQGGFKQKSLQLKTLKDYLKPKLAVDYEIFCGDFNTLGFYRFSGKRLQKIRELLGPEFINVFRNRRTAVFPQMLDHIFVKNLSLANTEILKLKGSDHFPLLAEIKI